MKKYIQCFAGALLISSAVLSLAMNTSGTNTESRLIKWEWEQKPDSTGYTPIELAVSRGNFTKVIAFHTAGGDLNIIGRDHELSLLHIAITKQHWSIARFLLKSGANTKKEKSISSEDVDGTLLQTAMENRCPLDICQQLIERNIDIEESDCAGVTPLHAAADYGHIEGTRFLLVHGANPNALDGDGDTPLSEAVISDNIEIVELLLYYGANPYQKSLLFRPPRGYASPEIASLILVYEIIATSHIPKDIAILMVSFICPETRALMRNS